MMFLIQLLINFNTYVMFSSIQNIFFKQKRFRYFSSQKNGQLE